MNTHAIPRTSSPLWKKIEGIAARKHKQDRLKAQIRFRLFQAKNQQSERKLDSCPMNKLLAEIAHRHGLTVADIMHGPSTRPNAAARREFFYRCDKDLGKTSLEMGEFTGRHPSGIRRAILAYEKSLSTAQSGHNANPAFLKSMLAGIANEFGVSFNDIRLVRRDSTDKVVLARQKYCYTASKETPFTFEEIASVCGRGATFAQSAASAYCAKHGLAVPRKRALKSGRAA